MNTDLIAYYNSRAQEYEKIYARPERQPELARATTLLHQTLQGKTVLEIACGTGYWTERLAKTATHITATDINPAVLEIARAKTYAPATVTFEQADLFHLQRGTQHESLFGGFIWSHIALQELPRFLDVVKGCVVPGGTIVLMDNIYVAGSSLPITRTDAAGNTYQTRRLENGTVYEVLKNFPEIEFLQEQLGRIATEISIIALTYFWIAICKSK